MAYAGRVQQVARLQVAREEERGNQHTGGTVKGFREIIIGCAFAFHLSTCSQLHLSSPACTPGSISVSACFSLFHCPQ